MTPSPVSSARRASGDQAGEGQRVDVEDAHGAGGRVDQDGPFLAVDDDHAVVERLDDRATRSGWLARVGAGSTATGAGAACSTAA